MKYDPVTGPLSREKFAELVAAPYGEAVKEIRKFDPQWGRKPGEKFAWEITATNKMEGRAIIYAADEKEANKIADTIDDGAFDWSSYDSYDIEIISVEPLKGR